MMFAQMDQKKMEEIVMIVQVNVKHVINIQIA